MAVFTFLVALSGAFVAGNDAGLIYGTYPMMADKWIPSDYWDEKLPFVRNMVENSAAVQFNHRLVAHILVAGFISMWFLTRKG